MANFTSVTFSEDYKTIEVQIGGWGGSNLVYVSVGSCYLKSAVDVTHRVTESEASASLAISITDISSLFNYLGTSNKRIDPSDNNCGFDGFIFDGLFTIVIHKGGEGEDAMEQEDLAVMFNPYSVEVSLADKIMALDVQDDFTEINYIELLLKSTEHYTKALLPEQAVSVFERVQALTSREYLKGMPTEVASQGTGVGSGSWIIDGVYTKI